MPEPYDLNDLNLPEDSELGPLLERCTDIERLVFRDEEYLVKEGGESLEIYVVLQGSFVVEQEKLAGDQSRGEPLAVQFAEVDTPLFIGEMAYIGNSFRTASVRCSGAVHTLCLKPEHLDIILDEFPFLARALSKQLVLRLKEADSMIKKFRADLDMNASHAFKKEGEPIVTQGEPADNLYQLVDGTLLKETSSGVETISVTQTPADFLNAREFFTNTANTATIKAKTSAILVTIDAAYRLAAIRNFPEVAQSVLSENA